MALTYETPPFSATVAIRAVMRHRASLEFVGPQLRADGSTINGCYFFRYPIHRSLLYPLTTRSIAIHTSSIDRVICWVARLCAILQPHTYVIFSRGAFALYQVHSWSAAEYWRKTLLRLCLFISTSGPSLSLVVWMRKDLVFILYRF